eukprot:8223698-Alexandrium_andersonii.AAC.1
MTRQAKTLQDGEGRDKARQGRAGQDRPRAEQSRAEQTQDMRQTPFGFPSYSHPRTQWAATSGSCSSVKVLALPRNRSTTCSAT